MNTNGEASHRMTNSDGRIFRAARASSVPSRAAMSWRSMARDRPAMRADSPSPFEDVVVVDSPRAEA